MVTGRALIDAFISKGHNAAKRRTTSSPIKKESSPKPPSLPPPSQSRTQITSTSEGKTDGKPDSKVSPPALKEDEKAHQAAIKVQAAARGHLARKQVKSMKEEVKKPLDEKKATKVSPPSAPAIDAKPAPPPTTPEKDIKLAPPPPAPEKDIKPAPPPPAPEKDIKLAPPPPAPEKDIKLAPPPPAPDKDIKLAPADKPSPSIAPAAVEAISDDECIEYDIDDFADAEIEEDDQF